MAEKYLTFDPSQTIDASIDALDADKVLVVTDLNVEAKVLPKLEVSRVMREAPRIALPAGEIGKSLDSVVEIWEKLEQIGATRRSVVLNIGGGVVTDMGGFAASAFKRGLRTVNFPTTLLGAVDAASGGKTGINFQGLKNEIGTFHLPSKVILSTMPFETLPQKEILSGYAEMVKTAIISDREFYFNLLDIEDILDEEARMGRAVEKCVMIKDEVVEKDPKETGLRKILNFGHTAGHAFESIAMEKSREISHGKAVAHGMLVALILSNIKLGFPSSEVNRYASFLKNAYGAPLISCEEVSEAILKMGNDKKNNTHGQPLFTLLREIGVPEINVQTGASEITEAMEIYREML